MNDYNQLNCLYSSDMSSYFAFLKFKIKSINMAFLFFITSFRLDYAWFKLVLYKINLILTI